MIVGAVEKSMTDPKVKRRNNNSKMDSLKGISQGCFQHKDIQSKRLSSQSSANNAHSSTQVSPPSVPTQVTS